MSEPFVPYPGPPSDNPLRTSSGGSLSPDALHELQKVRKSMRRMEKLLKFVCLLQLENQRLSQMESDYTTLFDLGANRQKRQRHRKSSVSLLDILS